MMRRTNLPNLIVALLVGFIALVISGLWISVESIRNAMNAQSRDASILAVESQIETLHDKVSMMARDYNNWADAYIALRDGDLAFVADNYAITAIFGDIVNAVLMFDGPLTEPVAWLQGGVREPTRSFLPDRVLQNIRKKVANLDIKNRATFDFFLMRGETLNFMSSSYLLPDTEDLLRQLHSGDAAVAVLARTLRESEIEDMERALSISEVRISTNLDPSQTTIPLIGVDGMPAAYISWMPQRTGDILVDKMLPVLVGIVIVFLVVAAVGTFAIHKNAKNLVTKEHQASSLARLDNLTGLGNRLAFNEYMAAAFNASPNTLALIVIDLNGFKRINDMVGHQGGDRVICRIANSLAEISEPKIFAVRLGGDEFAVVIKDSIDIISSVAQISTMIIQHIRKPFNDAGYTFEITAAQGVAIKDETVTSIEELLRRADYAMYFAKQQKSSRIKVYTKEMELISQADRQIEIAMREALDRPEEFYIHYQPIVKAKNGEFVRAEALARWEARALGNVGPDIFIGNAEHSGLIIRLGCLLFERICQDMRMHPDLDVSVNISPVQLMEDDFVDGLLSILAKHGVDPSRIEIEITEGVLILDSEIIAQRLYDLKSAGITVALDDFGSGYASVGALRLLPFDNFKIDKSIATKAIEGDLGVSMVKSIIQLGRSMNKKITGEGVETESEARSLSENGCDLIQGYFYGRPQPISDLVARFLNNKRVVA